MRHFAALAFVLLVTPILMSPAASNGTSNPRLYCGTDNTGFSGENGQLAVVRTSGSSTVGQIKVYNLSFPLNGITTGTGVLLSGQPEDVGTAAGNTLRTVSDIPGAQPALVGTITPASNSFPSSCCNEQMVIASDGSLYHSHYSSEIEKLTIDASGQSHVAHTFSQSDVVGMAANGATIWISKWTGRQVGTWDPVTNAFTFVFSTPSNAGGLAWDVANGVLWVGMEGGQVVPYNSSGTQVGSGFYPFGSISNTIDGLAFVQQ